LGLTGLFVQLAQPSERAGPNGIPRREMYYVISTCFSVSRSFRTSRAHWLSGTGDRDLDSEICGYFGFVKRLKLVCGIFSLPSCRSCVYFWRIVESTYCQATGRRRKRKRAGSDRSSTWEKRTWLLSSFLARSQHSSISTPDHKRLSLSPSVHPRPNSPLTANHSHTQIMASLSLNKAIDVSPESWKYDSKSLFVHAHFSDVVCEHSPIPDRNGIDDHSLSIE
jgi:hypothetical protein